MAPLLPADTGGTDTGLGAELDELVRLARAIALPGTDLPQWEGSAAAAYRAATTSLRSTIDSAVAALAAAAGAA